MRHADNDYRCSNLERHYVTDDPSPCPALQSDTVCQKGVQDGGDGSDYVEGANTEHGIRRPHLLLVKVEIT